MHSFMREKWNTLFLKILHCLQADVKPCYVIWIDLQNRIIHQQNLLAICMRKRLILSTIFY